jgi:hypothetical protein
MIKKVISIIIVFVSVMQICLAQDFFKTADLFHKPESIKNSGSLNIIQDPNVDTLIYRYILANKVLKQNGDGDMDGFRIQIYSSSDRNARDVANKIRADFMIAFPDISSDVKYRDPGYFLVKAGNFRTKLEGTKWLTFIRKKYPNAYLVPDVIYFPDQIKN